MSAALVRVDIDGILYDMSEEDAAEVRRLQELEDYLDKRQYRLKITMNSAYGALANPHFRFFDPRMGNSTTGTGRFVLEHLSRKVGEFFDGEYAYPTPSAIYGDTDSSYFATGATTIEDAIARADAFAKNVNETMTEFVRKTFLVQDAFANHISVDRELVADRGIFVDKKMYFLHVAEKKGKMVDAMKVMGLMIKKTLVPKENSRYISNLIEQWLTNKVTWQEFCVSVIEKRDELIDAQNIRTLGITKSVKYIPPRSDASVAAALTKPPTKGDKDPDAYHVLAARLWNWACEQNGDKESERISSGSKIKLYKLKRRVGRVGYIAVPIDQDPAPEWFLEQYWPMIDLKHQLKLIFDGPMAQILTAINKAPPTKNDMVAQECLEF